MKSDKTVLMCIATLLIIGAMAIYGAVYVVGAPANSAQIVGGLK